MKKSIAPAQELLHRIAALLLYQSTLKGKAGQAFVALLQAIVRTEQSSDHCLDCVQTYGRWFRAIAAQNQTWQDYLVTQILRDENPFSQQAQRSPSADLSPALLKATRHDLQILQQLAQSDRHLNLWVQQVCGLENAPIAWSVPTTDSFFPTSADWSKGLALLGRHYYQQGTGVFAFQALRWQCGQLVGIANPDSVAVAHLIGYEAQKSALIQNTEFLLKGLSALHVLLYGSRGSGKSSLVKGLLHQYGAMGLRLIEVAKADLVDLPTIVDRLRDLPQKFIIFVDDLSFEEDEDAYKALKVVLEGNLTARPQNVIVYATSNRRHLIREFFGDRPQPRNADEVHTWDTVQEKLSFSDRFGLTLTFEPADQLTYLTIVQHLAAQAELGLEQADLEHRALQWATRHNGRSGRTARQFVDFLQAELALSRAESA
jgi:predicted AAA+ superfamily ATPase